MRARVVLWSISGLASMKHFAIAPSDIVAASFFIHIQSFSGMFFFNQSLPWIRIKQTKTTARLIRACDTCAHPYIGMLQLHYSSVGAYSGYTRSRYSVYCCACARARYILYRTYFATTNRNNSSSAAAASFVCCSLLYAIYGSIDTIAVLLLDLNCIQ